MESIFDTFVSFIYRWQTLVAGLVTIVPGIFFFRKRKTTASRSTKVQGADNVIIQGNNNKVQQVMSSSTDLVFEQQGQENLSSAANDLLRRLNDINSQIIQDRSLSGIFFILTDSKFQNHHLDPEIYFPAFQELQEYYFIENYSGKAWQISAQGRRYLAEKRPLVELSWRTSPRNKIEEKYTLGPVIRNTSDRAISLEGWTIESFFPNEWLEIPHFGNHTYADGQIIEDRLRIRRNISSRENRNGKLFPGDELVVFGTETMKIIRTTSLPSHSALAKLFDAEGNSIAQSIFSHADLQDL